MIYSPSQFRNNIYTPSSRTNPIYQQRQYPQESNPHFAPLSHLPLIALRIITIQNMAPIRTNTSRRTVHPIPSHCPHCPYSATVPAPVPLPHSRFHSSDYSPEPLSSPSPKKLCRGWAEGVGCVIWEGVVASTLRRVAYEASRHGTRRGKTLRRRSPPESKRGLIMWRQFYHLNSEYKVAALRYITHFLTWVSNT